MPCKYVYLLLRELGLKEIRIKVEKTWNLFILLFFPH